MLKLFGMVLVRLSLSTKTLQNEWLIVHHCRNPHHRMGIWVFLLFGRWIDPRVISDRCYRNTFSSDQEGMILWLIVHGQLFTGLHY